MARIASAIFNDRTEAERAVSWLRDHGVPNDAITVIARNEGDDRGTASDVDRDASDSAAEAGSGLASGLGIGAGVGALFGLAAALIPGLGPLIVAGPLAAWLGGTAGTVAAGAIVGGTAGGLAGALSHWGLNEAEAHHYAGEVERGGTYVGVDLDRANLPYETVNDTFRRYHGRIQNDAQDTGYGRTPMAGAAAGTTGVGYGTEMARDYTEDVEVEARVPIVEEFPDVHKERRQAGEVNVTKRVETETRHISEPVTREQVSVDVRPVAGGAVDANATLEPGETISVPVYKEELVVDKHAEVTGEAVIRTHQQTERANRDVELRRERVEVDEIVDVDVDATDDVATDDVATTTRRTGY